MATYEQLKEALVAQLAADGANGSTVDALTASVQAQLYLLFHGGEQQQPAESSSSWPGHLGQGTLRAGNHALHVLILEYLQRTGLHASVSVFARETGLLAHGGGGVPRVERKQLLQEWRGLAHLPPDVPLLCGILAASTICLEEAEARAGDPAASSILEPEPESVLPHGTGALSADGELGNILHLQGRAASAS